MRANALPSKEKLLVMLRNSRLIKVIYPDNAEWALAKPIHIGYVWQDPYYQCNLEVTEMSEDGSCCWCDIKEIK